MSDDIDLDEWDDVLGAEPEKDFGKPKDEKPKSQALDASGSDDEGWNDVVEIEVLENYCSDLMKQMETFRKQGILCDASILVDDKELPVHKNVLSAVSPFFKNIFTRLKSATPEDSQIKLRNLSGQIMDDILHFTYTGEVCIHDGNVRQLLATSNFLQLSSLKEMTISYLENKLSPGSAVEIMILADKHRCHNLLQSAEKMISDNFSTVAKTDAFKKLTFEMLYQFVQSEDIRVMKEEEVYEAVMLWFKGDYGDQEEKEKHIPDLLHEVRFPLISPSYLNDIMEKETLVRRNKICFDIINEARNFHSTYNKEKALIDTKSTRPRKFMGVVWGIVTVGGFQEGKPTKDVFSYIASHQKWFPLIPLPNGRYNHGVVSCDGYIYVFGGRNDSTKLLSSAVRFDPTGNKWQNIAPLPYSVASLSVTVFAGQIYIAGGVTGVGSIDIVLKYSARNNVWQKVKKLSCPRAALCLVSDDKNIFAIGGIHKAGFNNNAQWRYLNTMEIYQREYNTWSFGSDLLSPRAYASAVCLNQKIYLFGGQSELFGISKGMDIYDISINEWTSAPYLGIPRLMTGIAVDDSCFYIVGGMMKNGQSVNTVETYDINKDRWSKIASLPTPIGSVQCCSMQLRLAVLQGMTTSFSE